MAILPVISVLSVLAFSPTTHTAHPTLQAPRTHLSPVHLSKSPEVFNQRNTELGLAYFATQSIQVNVAHVGLPSGTSVRRISSVNGNVYSPFELYVSSSIFTDSGNITLGANSVVAGSISTHKGKVLLDSVTVAGDIKSQYGDISLSGNTLIYGDVVLGYPNALSHCHEGDACHVQLTNTLPRVHIGENVRILGTLVINGLATLEIDNSASLLQIHFNTESLEYAQ